MASRGSTSLHITSLLIVVTLAGGATGVAITAGNAKPEVIIPAGTKFVAALSSEVSTEFAAIGDRIDARSTEAVQLDGVTLPSGVVRLRGEITEAKGGGRVKGTTVVAINFNRLEIQGHDYPIATTLFRATGSETKTSTKQVIGGAVVGTKRGILIGTAAGVGAAVATKGGHIVLPSGQRLGVALEQPVTINYRSDVAFTPNQ